MCGADVVGARRLEGGIDADTHVLALADARNVVLRQTRDTEWDDLERHAQVLQGLRPTPVPAPQVLGADPIGAHAGRPSLLMSLLSGEARVPVPPSDDWLRSLASTATQIHACPLDGLEWLPRRRERLEAGIARGPDPGMGPADLEVWQLVAARPELLDTGPIGLTHRDYWSGNTLRRGSQVVGVVDWSGACLGPPEVDAAECAFDLAIAHGPAVAERFLELWAEVSGRDAGRAQRWWLVTVINSLDLDEWLPAYPHLGVTVDSPTAWERREWLRARALEAARG